MLIIPLDQLTFMYMYMYMHMYMYMYICTHVYVHVHTCYIYMYMYIVVVERTSSHNRLVAACAADVAVSGPACGACIHGQPNEA